MIDAYHLENMPNRIVEDYNKAKCASTQHVGELAQLVERVLSMHEVGGSIPPFSKDSKHFVLNLLTLPIH